MKHQVSQPCKLTFKLDSMLAIGAEISLNGEPIQNIVRDFELTAKAGEVVRVVLDVIPSKIEIDVSKAFVTMFIGDTEYRLIEMGPVECEVVDSTSIGDTVQNFAPKKSE